VTNSQSEVPVPPNARWALAASWIIAAWLLFLWTHESGHILAALFTDGQIEQVVLHPLTFSRTDVSPNPAPMFVAWAGALLGPLIAAIVLLPMRCIPAQGRALYRTLLGFVLIANGVYIGLGIVQPVADAADMIRLGAPRWTLGLYGVPATALGLVLWEGLNPMGSLPRSPARTDKISAFILATLALVLAIAGTWCCPL
jgi:hypothetical protein